MFANLVPNPPVAPAMVADIFFNKSSKRYFAGEYVSGKVVFNTLEPIAVRYIRISWNGSAVCSWSGIEKDSVKEYISNSFIAWVSPDGKNELPAGTHKYRFNFRLPSDAPPTFSGTHGEISYSVNVELDRPWKWNVETTKSFRVVQKTCLAVSAPKMLRPAKYFNYKNSGTIIKDGLFSMKINFLKRAFLPGETIKTLVTMENHSSKPITQLEFNLIQQSHFHSRPQKTMCSFTNCIKDCPVSRKYRRDSEITIQGGIHKCNVAPHETKQVVVDIMVPSKLPATFESAMISMGYLLGFSVKNGSKTNNKLSCNARIVIGNEERIDETGEGRGFKKADFLPSPPPPPYHP